MNPEPESTSTLRIRAAVSIAARTPITLVAFIATDSFEKAI
jgi:hypothetical protein